MITWYPTSEKLPVCPPKNSPQPKLVLVYPGKGKDPVDVINAQWLVENKDLGVYTHWSSLNTPDKEL